MLCAVLPSLCSVVPGALCGSSRQERGGGRAGADQGRGQRPCGRAGRVSGRPLLSAQWVPFSALSLSLSLQLFVCLAKGSDVVSASAPLLTKGLRALDRLPASMAPSSPLGDVTTEGDPGRGVLCFPRGVTQPAPAQETWANPSVSGSARSCSLPTGIVVSFPVFPRPHFFLNAVSVRGGSAGPGGRENRGSRPVLHTRAFPLRRPRLEQQEDSGKASAPCFCSERVPRAGRWGGVAAAPPVGAAATGPPRVPTLVPAPSGLLASQPCSQTEELGSAGWAGHDTVGDVPTGAFEQRQDRGRSGPPGPRGRVGRVGRVGRRRWGGGQVCGHGRVWWV